MSLLNTQPVDHATGKTGQLFAAIRAAAGSVPNVYADIGSNSPLALDATLKLDAVLRQGSLSALDLEAIRLAVSEVAGCDYCLAAHTGIAKKLGLDKQAVLALRHGQSSGDAKLDALAHFARTLASTRGSVPAAVVDAVRSAGYNDTQIVDTLLAISSIGFTNLFNRVNATRLDFPPAD